MFGALIYIKPCPQLFGVWALPFDRLNTAERLVHPPVRTSSLASSAGQHKAMTKTILNWAPQTGSFRRCTTTNPLVKSSVSAVESGDVPRSYSLLEQFTVHTWADARNAHYRGHGN